MMDMNRRSFENQNKNINNISASQGASGRSARNQQEADKLVTLMKQLNIIKPGASREE